MSDKEISQKTSSGNEGSVSALVLQCLENGLWMWKFWAESWRSNPAYGAGQAEIHPTHAKIISEFETAIEISNSLNRLRAEKLTEVSEKL